jgi:hypothetical protein
MLPEGQLRRGLLGSEVGHDCLPCLTTKDNKEECKGIAADLSEYHSGGGILGMYFFRKGAYMRGAGTSISGRQGEDTARRLHGAKYLQA